MTIMMMMTMIGIVLRNGMPHPVNCLCNVLRRVGEEDEDFAH